MNFSEKLKEIRNNEGLSQEQLAEKIGVSRQAITKWETGKGLPDIENMMIIAEIFKTTLDELLQSSSIKPQAAPAAYASETIYDIDCETHFDISIGSAAQILLSSGTDEKLHIKLSSETLENLGSLFKIKLDETRNTLDVFCQCKNKLSRYEAEEALNIEILLPKNYSDHCELEASVKLLKISDLRLRRLEYDGDAKQVLISNSSGSLEFTGKTDYDITIDRITGSLDVNQFKAKSIVHIPAESLTPVVNKGRKCSICYLKDGSRIEPEAVPVPEASSDSKDKLSISGMFSELIIDLTE